MIYKAEIDQKAKEFNINPQAVEKDYVYGWLLNTLYCDSSLKDALILKGGGALRKGYLENTRFSKDLDFSLDESLDASYFTEELSKICTIVSDKTGVKFETAKTRVEPKIIPRMNKDIIEARVYFKGFYGEEDISLKAQLDITEFDKPILQPQKRNLIHPYSDYESISCRINCQKAEEIFASKLDTLLRRRKVTDIFDLMFSLIFKPQLQLSKKELIETFLNKTIYSSSPQSAKSELLNLQLADYSPFWTTIVAPAISLFNFDFVLNNYNKLIEDLFDLIIPKGIPEFAYAGYSRGSSSNIEHFSSNVRNTIINAGRTETMLDLVYDGYRRLVEPYEIRYYRRNDGVGQEYFWGYDNTGGKSGELSIKMFKCAKIESASLTNKKFTPKYPILV